MHDVLVLDTKMTTISNKGAEPRHVAPMTIRQFCAVFPWPSESAMRAYVYRAGELGLSEAFMRVRRRVLVHPERFFQLIEHLEHQFKEGSEREAGNPSQKPKRAR